MGHSTKKNKKGHRRPPADHASVDSDLLAKELTSLRAILKEDFELLAENQIKIKLRPNLQDLDVSATLLIRFFDGYPYKSPKLQIESVEGLAESDADNLLSLLNDQANLNAREGRVMVYNLVEAACKFFAEVTPRLSRETVAVSSDKGPFVYGFLDLFLGFVESWQWGLSVEESSSTSTTLHHLPNDILRVMHNSEDTSVYDKVVGAVFSEEMINTKKQANVSEVKEISSIQHTVLDAEIRDLVREVSSMVFRLHCAKRLEINPMCLLGDSLKLNRNVKHLSDGGDMIELCHELRLPFINWVVLNQKSSFKRFEISYVYRRSIDHSLPSRYLQGDFDVIGGACVLTEAEVIKVAMDIITWFIHPESCDIHLNHGDLLEAIWLWTGVKADHRQKVAELLSLLGSLRPQSTERKSMWVVIKRKLKQELDITEDVVNRLQSVELRFCGAADHALPRLRGAMQGCVNTLAMKALDKLSQLLMYLRIWKIDKNVFIDPLMPPTESYHKDSFFGIHLRKCDSVGNPTQGTLLAVGGRYDYLLHQMWRSKYKSNLPGAVGTSLALETIIRHSSVDICRPFRNDSRKSVLVCSRGGGGLVDKRMELVHELWEDDIKADFVPIVDPSPKEQYDYAKEHGVECLIDMSEGSVKIRHLELKIVKEVTRESLVKVLSEEMASQFRSL